MSCNLSRYNLSFIVGFLLLLLLLWNKMMLSSTSTFDCTMISTSYNVIWCEPSGDGHNLQNVSRKSVRMAWKMLECYVGAWNCHVNRRNSDDVRWSNCVLLLESRHARTVITRTAGHQTSTNLSVWCVSLVSLVSLVSSFFSLAYFWEQE